MSVAVTLILLIAVAVGLSAAITLAYNKLDSKIDTEISTVHTKVGQMETRVYVDMEQLRNDLYAEINAQCSVPSKKKGNTP